MKIKTPCTFLAKAYYKQIGVRSSFESGLWEPSSFRQYNTPKLPFKALLPTVTLLIRSARYAVSRLVLVFARISVKKTKVVA